MASDPALIAIVGPTASGKTSLALSIAEKFNGEIICADSRTVYKDMDIGTAKPSIEEQARVPHWGLDIVTPGERFTAADFKEYALAAISDIRSRGKLPLLVGGTGLYVDAVLYDFSFAELPSVIDRKKYEGMSVGGLVNYCYNNNVMLPENHKNKRHLITAIERKSVSSISKSALPDNFYVVGIATNKTTLRTRIVDRSEQLFQNGVAKEATILGEKYGWDNEAMTGNVYPLIRRYLQGELSMEQVKDMFSTLDSKLAKRQMTWLRRNPDIMWATLHDAEQYISSLVTE